MDDTGNTASGKNRSRPKDLAEAIEVIASLEGSISELSAKLDDINQRLAKAEMARPVNLTREKMADLIVEASREGNSTAVGSSIRSFFGNEIRTVLRGNQEAHAAIAEMARQHITSLRISPEQIAGVREFIIAATQQHLEGGTIRFSANRR